jgi:hypothetical protein
MFLANENFPRPCTILLRKNGFIVKSIQEDSPREKGDHAQFAAASLLSILRNNSIELLGAFTVIEANNIRQRFYKK